MSMYDWDDLIKRWEAGSLTIKQAIGQLFLWGQLVAERLQRLKVRISNLENRLMALERHLKK